jgi:hypothetical protein
MSGMLLRLLVVDGGITMFLSKKSINWAKQHIDKYFDSDFYVKPFEFKAIWANWGEVENYLVSTQLETLVSRVKRPIVMPTPKKTFGFRMVHQLDPIDSLIYTALAHEISELVEAKRVSESEGVVFSYRIKPDDSGNFFSQGTGYTEFKKRSTELAKKYSYVLVTDITDFYNQIYHHRLQNAIQSCGDGLDEISKIIERFLMELTNQVSRGVPVGPAASIVFAEASLIDIDDFILNREFDYVRYVDDIRIFSNSIVELERILHDLTAYLYKSHRLVLSSSKTKIINTDDFVAQYIDDPVEKEKEAIHEAIKSQNIQITGDYPYLEPVGDIENLPPESKVKAQAKAFVNLMEDIIGLDTLDLGLARHILRRARYLRTRAILPLLLKNFDKFAPVIRDVMLYLGTVTNSKMFEYNQASIEDIVTSSRSYKYPHVKYWVDNYLADTKFTLKSPILRGVVSKSVIRIQAINSITQRLLPWVREHKDMIDQVSPWDRRAIIYSGQILSKDERTHWMDSVLLKEDIVDRSIASYIKSFL